MRYNPEMRRNPFTQISHALLKVALRNVKYFLASSFNLDSRANIKCEKCQENLQKHLTTIDFFVAFKVKHAI